MISMSKELQTKQSFVNPLDDVKLIGSRVTAKEEEVIIANIYMPPQTNTWGKEEYRKLTGVDKVDDTVRKPGLWGVQGLSSFRILLSPLMKDDGRTMIREDG